MTKSYRVSAPYVTLKVRDQLGAWMLTGFYEGAVVSDVDPVSLKHHLDSVPPMVEEVDSPKAAEVEAAEVEQPSGDGRPSVRAAKEDWVTYAVSKRADGVSEDDARAQAEATSKADLVTEYGG